MSPLPADDSAERPSLDVDGVALESWLIAGRALMLAGLFLVGSAVATTSAIATLFRAIFSRR
jgi:hypothetical protein